MTLSVTIQLLHRCASVWAALMLKLGRFKGDMKNTKHSHTCRQLDADPYRQTLTHTHGMDVIVSAAVSSVQDKEGRGGEHYYTLHGTLIFLPNGTSHSCQQLASWSNKFCLMPGQARDGRRGMRWCVCVYCKRGRGRTGKREASKRPIRRKLDLKTDLIRCS